MWIPLEVGVGVGHAASLWPAAVKGILGAQGEAPRFIHERYSARFFLRQPTNALAKTGHPEERFLGRQNKKARGESSPRAFLLEQEKTIAC